MTFTAALDSKRGLPIKAGCNCFTDVHLSFYKNSHLGMGRCMDVYFGTSINTRS